MKTVLIVDDEIIIIRALMRRISWETLGFSEVLSATSMQQAQELFRQKEIDIMLCDIEMPDGSGLDLFEWVKSYFPYVECIYITCHPDFPYIQRALRLGSFDYLLKPINYKELTEIIKRALISVEEHERIKKPVHQKARDILCGNEKVFEVSDDAVRLIKKYVKDHLNEELVMVNLADIVHLNARHMVRVFKKQEGVSILEYITNKRIDMAKKLLEETDQPITQVADTVGYTNYSYFSRIFKKTEGVTPQEYRKNKST